MSVMRYKLLPERRIVHGSDSTKQIDNHWELTPRMRFWFGVPPIETLRMLGFEGGSKDSFTYFRNKVNDQTLDDLTLKMVEKTKINSDQFWFESLATNRLHDWQSKGIHFFYVNGEDFAICTCGLFVKKDSNRISAKDYFGHRAIPSFGKPVFSFLIQNHQDEENGSESFLMVCQLCRVKRYASTSFEGLEMASEHPKACPCVEWVD